MIGFGEFLRSWRLTRGYSLRELARDLEVPHSYIAELEKNNPSFALSVMKRLAPYLTKREVDQMLEAVKSGIKRDLEN